MCIENSVEFNKSFFKDDLSLNYGEKHFITELAEIAIIDFFKDGVPEVFDEISEFIDRAWDKVQVNKQSTMLSSIRQRAWRFFADLSPKGKVWYSERIGQSEFCLSKELHIAKIISTSELDVEPIQLEFNKWHSLSIEQKSEFAEWFILNPIDSTDAIINSPYHEEMKHNL